MSRAKAITTIFVDIGGVLLSKGWGHEARAAAAQKFELDPADLSRRHRLSFGTYELGKMTLTTYLRHIVFYEPRSFTMAQFKAFMLAQSQPIQPMLDLIGQLKAEYGVKVFAVNNEGRELNAYRIRHYQLNRFVDSFISSCFVHLRKPDEEIYRLALDLAQARAQHVIYLEDEPQFVRVARRLGLRGIIHQNVESTCDKLAALGLRVTAPDGSA